MRLDHLEGPAYAGPSILRTEVSGGPAIFRWTCRRRKLPEPRQWGQSRAEDSAAHACRCSLKTWAFCGFLRDEGARRIAGSGDRTYAHRPDERPDIHQGEVRGMAATALPIGLTARRAPAQS